MIIPSQLNRATEVMRVTVDGEQEVFTTDFSGRLAAGEVIANAAHTFTPASGLTLVNESESDTFAQFTVTSQLEGLYDVRVLVTTSLNRVLESNGLIYSE